MNNRNKALLTIAVATTLGAAWAMQNKFSDIPKDFWAEGAVSRMVAEGIVSGYPDGTFRGTNNVNRYEVTSMFDRLFLSRRFITLETNARATATELGNLRAADARTNANVTALQADVEALKGSNNQTLNVDDRFDNIEKQATERDAAIAALRAELEAMKTQTSQIARLTEQNTALSARVTQLEQNAASSDSAALSARVAQLEQQAAANANSAQTIATLQNQVGTLTTRLEQLEQRPAASGGDTTALNARVVALEAQTARIPALEAQIAKIPALETQVARIPALETQVGSLNTTVANLQKAIAERPTVPATTAPNPPATTAPNPPATTAPNPPATTAPNPPATTAAPEPTAPELVAPSPAAPAGSTLFVSLGLSSNLLPSGGYRAALGVGAMAQVGLNLSDSFSVRFSADFSEIPSFGVNGLLNLGNGFYAGVGGGLVFAGGGVYLGGVVGFSFNIAQNFGLFLEANPRLNFSTGFGIKTAFGVRIGL